MDNLKGCTEWVTTQDCMGIPGFPTGAANVRKKLDLLASGNPTMKRKREGSKAYEYHVSILPDISRRYFVGNDSHTTADVKIDAQEQDYNFWWEAIFKALSGQELESIVESFKCRGKQGVFTEELLGPVHPNNLELSQSAINTALVLEKLTEAERREILAQYGFDEQGCPVAPKKEPQSKAG